MNTSYSVLFIIVVGYNHLLYKGMSQKIMSGKCFCMTLTSVPGSVVLISIMIQQVFWLSSGWKPSRFLLSETVVFELPTLGNEDLQLQVQLRNCTGFPFIRLCDNLITKWRTKVVIYLKVTFMNLKKFDR